MIQSDADIWVKIHRENERMKRELGVNMYGEPAEPEETEEDEDDKMDSM